MSDFDTSNQNTDSQANCSPMKMIFFWCKVHLIDERCIVPQYN